MKHFIHIFTFISLFTLSCCTPDEDPLAACKADPNCEYFTCLVDGEKWTPSCTPDPLFGCDPFDVQYNKDIPGLEFVVENSNKNEVIIFRGRERLKLGKNNFFSNEFIQTEFGNSNLPDTCISLPIDPLLPNNLLLTVIDSTKFILEGEFFLTCKNKCGNKVEISKGSFRIKYRF